MSELDILSVAAGGMGVQRALLDVAARNVAAAQASTPEHPYPRLVARFASADPADAFLGVPDDEENAGDEDGGGARLAGTVRSGETADALTEMIAVLDAQRAYEANASVFDVGKRLAERTIDVGRL
ncbi:MAG TPA: flagellar basal body rod C-terminal domain-containing protein [Candidatus Elarobacter sp.]|jgi:flagellar basal-body rod protein FlgC|nr:flagellar basal body rod C-terminal domain-containing protein [Candidatus Elarobacter sp.]